MLRRIVVVRSVPTVLMSMWQHIQRQSRKRRSGSRLRQRGHRRFFRFERGARAVIHSVKHRALVRELYLGLGRVDVHVHGRTAELHIQHARGEAAHEQRVAVGLFERGLQCGGADPPAVAEEVLLRAAAAPGGGRGDEASPK